MTPTYHAGRYDIGNINDNSSALQSSIRLSSFTIFLLSKSHDSTMNTLFIDDEDEATIAVTLSTSSPTFFLSSDSLSFEIFVHARMI